MWNCDKSPLLMSAVKTSPTDGPRRAHSVRAEIHPARATAARTLAPTRPSAPPILVKRAGLCGAAEGRRTLGEGQGSAALPIKRPIHRSGSKGTRSRALGDEDWTEIGGPPNAFVPGCPGPRNGWPVSRDQEALDGARSPLGDDHGHRRRARRTRCGRERGRAFIPAIHPDEVRVAGAANVLRCAKD
jgi:hypothetical protein